MNVDPEALQPAEIPPPPAPSVSRTQRRAKAAADALRTLLRDLHLDRHGAELPAGELAIRLQLRVNPARDWELAFDPPLVEQYEAQLDEARAEREAYRKGAVFCFRCASSDCEHARPPAAQDVFHGYDEIGRPEWRAFHQTLIEAKDDRVDQLYSRPPAVLTRVHFGRHLRGRQLASFGRSSRTYAILGQVTAGYFPPPRAVDPAERIALTFQIVEARDAAGTFRLHLNPIARLPAGETLDTLLGAGWQPDILRARNLALRALAALEHRVQGARDTARHEDARRALHEVATILHRLADFLDRGHRQGLRRTRHAEQRRQENRPVHKAQEDARAMPPASFFFDQKAGTYIVCGPKGRTHAFSGEGRHVTSFLIKPDSIEFRLRTERWRQATPEELAHFRTCLPPDNHQPPD